MTAGRLAIGALRGALRADKSPRARRLEAVAAGGHPSSGARLARFAGRWGVALSIALGVAVAVLLRAPWLDAALGRDEGGVALIARAAHGSGPFPYGSYFLDRPPLLVGLYKLVGAGPGGIRALGLTAAALLVVVSTLLAVRLAGRAAAPWAAVITAVLASSFALKSVFTPAELLAVVPSCASVLLLITALERPSRRFWLLGGAGALAVTALLVKQSFGDALAAGSVALVAGKLLGEAWRETLKRAAAYGAGAGAVVVALVVWAWLDHTSAGSVWYAMFGFRLDAVAPLAGSGIGTRLARLGTPALSSGLAVAGAFAVFGIARLRGGSLVRLVLVTWVLAALAGVALGGSYWPHYLIALVAAAAAGAAAVFARYRWVGALAICTIVLPVAWNAANVARSDGADSSQQSTLTIARYIDTRAKPHQTLYALYAKVNLLYYAGLRDPFPYNWSLMMRAAPNAQARLRHLLASGGRPTWVVEAQPTRAFGLDRSGATKRLLAEHYRRFATVCGDQLLLARGARSAPPGAAPTSCGQPTTQAAAS